MWKRRWSSRLLLEIFWLRGSYQILLSKGFQHLLVALATADLLPAPAVESGFFAIDCRHSCLLPSGLHKTVNSPDFSSCAPPPDRGPQEIRATRGLSNPPNPMAVP